MADCPFIKRASGDRVIALIGNPNVGKSSVFNALTGMKQHTGNWPGKTVEVAHGYYFFKGERYILVDLPGTYSLSSRSEEERVAVDFVSTGNIDCAVIVVDATSLERNLNLALQVMNITGNVLLCVNLMDEADRKQITVNLHELEKRLGIPTIGMSAISGNGIPKLKETLHTLIKNPELSAPIKTNNNQINQAAREISNAVVSGSSETSDIHWDRIVLGKWTGPVLMLLLLLLLLWLTLFGANYLSDLLSSGFSYLGETLQSILRIFPEWLRAPLLDGIYSTVSIVISVMLPPMLIFFPLFSFLEDLGYLPRAAFLLDHHFQKCGTCGKQALTMSMGLGCNAVGVTGCRIISSPKERIIAAVTNSFMPCNGRFPTLIILITAILGGSSFLSGMLLLGIVLFAVLITFFISALLTSVTEKERNSFFVLELPPYRKPRLKTILIRAFLDRTVYVLARAILVAAPAGLLIWLIQTLEISNTPLYVYAASLLEPFGIFLGLNGIILLAFLLSFPANELFIPMVVMMMSSNMIVDQNSLSIQEMLIENECSWKTMLCMIIFTLFHWPCGTTCLTIWKETKSTLWTAVSILLPTIIGMILCVLINIIF